MRKALSEHLKNFNYWKEHHLIEFEFGYLLWRWGTKNSIEIIDIFVESDKRKKGIGSRMVNMLYKENPEFIYAFTKSDNKTAQKFYAHCGMEKIGEIKGNYIYGK